jgi:NADH:ubiquinone oxidoreductase subunit 6 (subunit J)
MQPILVWSLGWFSILAAVVAITSRQPARSIRALVVVMSTTAVMVFVLEASFLAVEMGLVILGAVFMVWAVLIRSGRMRLGASGRARWSITRMITFFSSLYFGFLLLWTLSQSPPVSSKMEPTKSLEGGFGFWLSFLLVGSAVVTTLFVLGTYRHHRDQRVAGPAGSKKNPDEPVEQEDE